MELQNALKPGPDQIQALLRSRDTGPVVMINLLRFRPLAVYADERPTELTGLEAFMVYSQLMQGIVEGYGGRFLISTLLDGLVIGTGEMTWHRMGLVEYPSRQAFTRVMADPEVGTAAVHRHAGLEGQLLISSTLQVDHRIAAA